MQNSLTRLSPVAESDQPQVFEGTADAVRYENLPTIEPLDVTVPEPERFHEAVARAQLSAGGGRPPSAARSTRWPVAASSETVVEPLSAAPRDAKRPEAVGIPERKRCIGQLAGLSGGPALPCGRGRLPAAQVHRFREAVIIAAGIEGTTLAELFDWRSVQPKKPWFDATTAFFEALPPTQARERVEALLRTIVKRFGDSPERLHVLRDIVVETSRFSFSPLTDRPLSGPASEFSSPSQRTPPTSPHD